MARHRTRMRRLAVVLAVAAATLAGPVGTAYGQTPAGSQYSGNLGQSTHSGGSANGGTTLPFTGLDLGAVAGVGVLLIGSGAVLRRRASHPAT